MSVASTPVFSGLVAAPAVPSEPIWRISLERYQAMIASGTLSAEDPVELLEGWLVYKMPKNPPHESCLDAVLAVIPALLPKGWFLRIQQTIQTSDSQPEPDASIVRGDRHQYASRHPRADDLGLVIEVADSTLRTDRGIKRRLYARAGIANYWIINLPDRVVEVHSEPVLTEGIAEYRSQCSYSATEQVPLILDAQLVVQISVAELLPG